MAKQPDYRRPFEPSDFRGYFRWSARFTERLHGRLYHACHEKELEAALDSGCLGLRSKWTLDLTDHGHCDVPGVWLGLNRFEAGNYYGPFLIRFPIESLSGRTFMVFRRNGDRRRYFFVQYESKIPVYAFKQNPWRQVSAASYFEETDGTLQRRADAVYDIVLSESLPLDGCEVEAVAHPYCITNKCRGKSRSQSSKLLRQIAQAEFWNWMAESESYRTVMERFPALARLKVELRHPLEFDDDA